MFITPFSYSLKAKLPQTSFVVGSFPLKKTKTRKFKQFLGEIGELSSGISLTARFFQGTPGLALLVILGRAFLKGLLSIFLILATLLKLKQILFFLLLGFLRS